MKYSKSFSLVEVLFCLVILGILGAGALVSITSLKRQDASLQHFLLESSGVFETQLFINKMLSFAKVDSIKINGNTLVWQGFPNLFMPAKNGENFMDFSLQSTNYEIKHTNNNLYFNNALLLHNVKLFSLKISNINTDRILEYNICTHICLQDFIFLDSIEIDFEKL